MRRREEVLRIVRETTVHSQDDLLGLLKRRGFNVTQPTLSRDLRELGLAKTPSGYVIPGLTVAPAAAHGAAEQRLEQLIRNTPVLFAEAAGNLLVIKTPPATAQPLASALDAADLEDALGTIGGDDTIFIAFRTPAAAEAFARHVQTVAGITPSRRRPRA